MINNDNLMFRTLKVWRPAPAKVEDPCPASADNAGSWVLGSGYSLSFNYQLIADCGLWTVDCGLL